MRFAMPLLKKRGLPFELFIVGNYAGKWNDFDQHVEPPARFASIETLRRLVDAGGRIQWRTRTHCRLDDLTDADLERELDPGEDLRRAFPEPHHFRWFAYPHGKVAPRVKAAAAARFAGALACDDGDPGDRYNLPRTLVFESTPLSRNKVSVVVANYNYGQFLTEALDSVLDQSVPPDEILIADDCFHRHVGRGDRVLRAHAPRSLQGSAQRALFGFEEAGVFWPTVEHYFQAQKFSAPEQAAYREKIRAAKPPKDAKTLGRTRAIPIRADWNEARDEVMLHALRKKFESSALRERLLSTGLRPLVEASPTDAYWGSGRTGSGRNRLGQLLMQVRAELRSASVKQDR